MMSAPQRTAGPTDRPVLLRTPGRRDVDQPAPALGPLARKAQDRLRRATSDVRPDTLLMLLTLFLALQFAIPARLVIGGLGAAGRPSVVVALVLGLTWLAAWLCIDAIPRGRQPVRWIVLAYFGASLLAYAAGYGRGLTSAEASGADRHLILVVAMCGLALAMADGIRSRRALDVVLVRLTWFGGLMAAVGAVQAVLRVDLTEYIKVPGLRTNRDLIGIGDRGTDDQFARVAGTANHYIEFGVVLAMIAPLAIHYALQGRDRAQRVRRWSLTLLILTGVPFSVSRSAVVALAVSLTVLALVWTWRTRLRAAAAGVLAVTAFSVAQPGLLGTIRSLFTSAEDDPSVQNRLSDYPVVQAYVAERPVLGRGLATFLPDLYVLLDNQLLLSAVTTGFIGLAAFVALFLGGALVGRSVRHHGANDADRHLGQALAAALLGGLVASATFDSFFFPTFVGVTFLGLGAVGALRRLGVPGGAPESDRTQMPGFPAVVADSLGGKWRDAVGAVRVDRRDE
jgi:hypothetical protein